MQPTHQPIRFVVETGTLVVSADDAPIPAGAFLVESGRIAAVGAVSDFSADDARVDLKHTTVAPGLVDSHVHVEFDPIDDDLLVIGQYGIDRADDVLTARAVVNLQLMLTSGVTTVRDCASSMGLVRLRDRLNDGQLKTATPRLYACGLPLTVTAGHLAWVGLECDDPHALRRSVRHVIAGGADAIKVVTSGGTMTAGSNPRQPQFSAADLAIVAEEAHRLEKRVIAHALNARSITSCVEAGIDSVDHAHWVTSDGEDGFSEAVAEAIVSSRTNIGMTASGWTRDLLAVDDEDLAHRFRNHKRLRELGADLTLHTDAGSTGTSFEGIADSLRVFMRAMSCTARDAYRAVTLGGSSAIGVGQVGRLTAGAHADFIATNLNPLDDVAALDDILDVYVAGRNVVHHGMITI